MIAPGVTAITIPAVDEHGYGAVTIVHIAKAARLERVMAPANRSCSTRPDFSGRFVMPAVPRVSCGSQSRRGWFDEYS
jgi:hypothetical protein